MVYKAGPPGAVVWKFVLDDGVYYRNRNKDAIEYFFHYCIQKDVKIYFRNNNGWNLVADLHPQVHCQCGREYTFSHNGDEFIWHDRKFADFTKATSVIEVFNSPGLCQMCYYSKELTEGRWAPKFVRDQLQLE